METITTTPIGAKGEEILKKRIQKLLQENDLLGTKEAIVIGVSGGSDSVALLHLLSVLRPHNRCIAVYIDHGLRPLETDAELKLVKTLAESFSATFLALTVDVAGKQKKKKCSLEEAARHLRYQALETVRKRYKGQCIAVGHTSDDQAEEVLLRLIRGSGSAGLSGMAIQNGFIIRPLLHESKKTLRAYLNEQNITYCEDSSNNDLRFLRNKIRHDLLPNLEQGYNQSIRTTLIQTAAILDEENKLLDSLTDKLFQKVCTLKPEQVTLDLATFPREHFALQRRIFEKICWQMAARPSFKQIASLLNLIHQQNGSEIHLSKGLRALKQQETILFHYPVKEAGYRGPAVLNKTFAAIIIATPGTYCIEELGYELKIRHTDFTGTLLQQPDTLVLDDLSISFPLTLRHHHDGEVFHPLGSPGSKKISRFFTDQKIAATERMNYPVLVADKTILAVLGFRIDNRYRAQVNTATCLQLQWKKLQ
jgi:tRNA(Ile)-lysidine synthase